MQSHTATQFHTQPAPASLWGSTAHSDGRLPPLSRDVNADVAIIGGGIYRAFCGPYPD